MINSGRVVDQIAYFTSARDTDLLEFSLLKTVNGLLKALSIRLLKVDRNNTPIKEVNFNNGRYDINLIGIEIEAEILSMIEAIQKTDNNKITRILGTNFVNVNLLLDSRHTNSFLITITSQKLTPEGEYLLNGIYQVYQNFSQLLIESQTDVLTGLANRKTFDDTINKVFDSILLEDEAFPNNQRNSEKSDKAKYWLAIIDIDHFKKVNDTYGHLYGDEVLVLFSNLIASCFREYDMIFRFGGEEFVVILRTSDLDACTASLERFRQTIEKTEFPGVGHITATIGAVQMSRKIFHVTLIDYADQALYYGKEHGRNQLNFFEDLMLAGKTKLESVIPGEIVIF